MMASPMLLAGAGLIMVVSAAILFTDTGSGAKRLRERVQSTRDLRSGRLDNPDSLVFAPVQRSLLFKAASLLGYQSDLPAAYAASPRVVVPFATLLGVVVFNLGGRVIPSIAALAVGLAVAIIAARFLFLRKSKAYNALLFRQIPDSMSLMLRAVRAGLPITEAIRNVGRESMSPTREEFARVAGETALGSPIELAMRRLADRTKIQEYAFFSVIIGLHSQTGGNLSETLENMADLVRRRVAMAAKGKALSAEGRLSAAVVGGLPFVVAGLTMVLNPGYIDEFVVNPNGPTLLIAFAALLGTGLFITHLLIQRSMED